MRVDMDPVTDDRVGMRALGLEAIIVYHSRFVERNELGESEVEHGAHVALAKVGGHLVLGRVLRLRVPRLLLLRELLVGAQRVSAPGSPVGMDVDHLHTLVSRTKIRLLDAW